MEIIRDLKQCSRCGELKPLSAFHQQKRSPDGRRSRCALCITAVHRERMKSDDHYAARIRKAKKEWKIRNRDYTLAYGRVDRAKYPEKHRRYWHNYAGRNREMVLFLRRNCAKVQRAIKKGILVRPEKCQQCGQTGTITSAHSDYGKPLDVVWLCKSCHSRWDHKNPKLVPLFAKG